MFHLALTSEEFGHAVLQDIGLILVIAILFAGALHTWLRKAMPSLQWNKAGKVTTEKLTGFDILGALFVSLPFTATLLLARASGESNLSMFDLILSFGILLMMAGVVFFIYQQRQMLHDALGLEPKHPVQVVSWALGAYIVFLLIGYFLQVIGLEEWLTARLGEQQNQVIVDEIINATNSQKRLVIVIGACVIAPFAEEIIFRGYLYPVVKRFTEPVIAALFTGVLFGAVHGQIWAVIPLSIFGVLLAILYEKSGSIWACILCHALFNSINVAIMLTSPGPL